MGRRTGPRTLANTLIFFAFYFITKTQQYKTKECPGSEWCPSTGSLTICLKAIAPANEHVSTLAIQVKSSDDCVLSF